MDANRMSGLIGLLVPIGFFVAVWGVAYVLLQSRTRREAHRVQLHEKLLERVGSARELGDFLSSAAGERFLKSMEPVPPMNRLWLSIRFGSFAIVFALVLLVANFFRWLDGGEDLVGFAFFILAFGAAALISAWISYSAAKKLGLQLPPEDRLPSA